MSDDKDLDLVSQIMREFSLIQEIKSAESQKARKELISELENIPIGAHPFHDRWIRINEAHSHSGWTERGFEPRLSDIPKNIQILAAVGYGKSDIENGGFHQFFCNPTGAFAPEMIEWFKNVGLKQSASIMKDATAIFGDTFPRSQNERREFLDQHPADSKGKLDPFKNLNQLFYDSFSDKDKLYNIAADKWLKEICGVTHLGMSIDKARSIEN